MRSRFRCLGPDTPERFVQRRRVGSSITLESNGCFEEIFEFRLVTFWPVIGITRAQEAVVDFLFSDRQIAGGRTPNRPKKTSLSRFQRSVVFVISEPPTCDRRNNKGKGASEFTLFRFCHELQVLHCIFLSP